MVQSRARVRERRILDVVSDAYFERVRYFVIHPTRYTTHTVSTTRRVEDVSSLLGCDFQA